MTPRRKGRRIAKCSPTWLVLAEPAASPSVSFRSRERQFRLTLRQLSLDSSCLHAPTVPCAGNTMKTMPGALNSLTQTTSSPDVHRRTIYWLQGVTLCWMIVECGVAIISAGSAHSPALLAFGADSLVEFLSAFVVLLRFTRWIKLTPPQAARIAGILLFILAGVVLLISLGTLLERVSAANQLCAGIGITIAALVVMPLLAWGKRKAALSINNRALAADAVQSAACAYLAAITLFGLALNALWHFHWADPVAALAAIPILIVEGRSSLQGETLRLRWSILRVWRIALANSARLCCCWSGRSFQPWPALCRTRT